MNAMQTADSPKPKVGIWILLSCVVLIIALFDRFRHPLDMTADCAMYLQCGQLLLSGQVPYVDFYDLNPPLIMYLNVVPAFLATLTHLPVIPVYWCLIWVFSVVSWLCCFAVLKRGADSSDWRYLGSFLLAAALINLTVKEIGQREHLFVLFYLPFFLLRWWRWQGGQPKLWESIPLGLLCGIALALKPYFVLVAALPELYWLLSKRSLKELWASEILAIVLFGVLYLAHFMMVPQLMCHNFFQQLIPMVNGGYDYMNCAFPPALPMNKRMFLVLLVLPVSWLLRSRSSLIPALLMWVLGGYLLLAAQQKGFVYHAIPMFSGIILLAGLVIGILGSGSKKYVKLAAYTVGLVLAAGLVGPDVWLVRQNPYQSVNGASGGDFAAVILKESQPGDSIFFASIPVQDPYPISVQLNRMPGCRYLWLFPVACYEQMKAKEKNADKQVELQNQEDQLLAEIVADVKIRRPRLIFLWRGSFTVDASPKSPIFLFKLLDHQGLGEIISQHYESAGKRGDTEIFKLKTNQEM